MRLPATLLGAAFLLIAGCVEPAVPPPAPSGPAPLVAADIQVPEGATLEPVAGGFAARWPAASLPIREEIQVPAHATLIRAVLDAPEGTRLAMAQDETGRRRCNSPTVESFTSRFSSPISCSSLALLDVPGTAWRVVASGTGKGTFSVEFLSVPPDGLLAGLDLALIDPPALELQETQFLQVPSWDGTPLRVEVTLPEGEGPWPAVIESSPYHDDGVRTEPASWSYFVEDWARRGYAIVVADVRGFGDSGGCVEVWGPNEQKDQAFLVEWAAAQPWSDGNVGFYGQSYVGTTPVEAAVLAPEHLKAIIAVAPVISAYEDWHHGGVPDGENSGSPVAYQAMQDAPPGQRTDPETIANNSANGLCDPTLTARANDPRAVYDAFYEERDFKKKAAAVRAAVLYTQGFEDANVKSDMVPGWFNAIPSQKLGLFGHWLHQHPSRADTEALMVAWMEQHLKGKPIGLESLPAVAVLADRGRERYADAWPPLEPGNLTLWPDFGQDTLGAAPADGSAAVLLDHLEVATLPVGESRRELAFEVAEDVALAGVATVHVRGSLEGVGTAYLDADLYDGDDLVGWGQFHLAHNADHTAYTPVAPGQAIEVDIPVRATEHVFEAGATLRLVLRGVSVPEATDPFGVTGLRFTFEGGADGTRLVLPTVPVADYHPAPLTAQP